MQTATAAAQTSDVLMLPCACTQPFPLMSDVILSSPKHNPSEATYYYYTQSKYCRNLQRWLPIGRTTLL